MSCCGSKREAYGQLRSGRHSDPSTSLNLRWPDVLFEYTGEIGLTVIGNVSGRRYRFNEKGETLLIDYRDVSGMTRVPLMVRKTEQPKT